MTHTVESLTTFTERIRIAFLAKSIPGPVHLCSDTQAQPLIDIFKDIRPQDWVFSTWRSSFHALLKGIPEADVFAQIIEGRSMYLSSREHRFYCSSIVGGILPIALGVAAGIQEDNVRGGNRGEPLFHDGFPLDAKPRQLTFCTNLDTCSRCAWVKGRPKVWVFIGDMAARTGLFHEFCQYYIGHNLPIEVVIENNELSTNARTRETWGLHGYAGYQLKGYEYERTHPHVGIGQKVQF